jgi:hypothetical protein
MKFVSIFPCFAVMATGFGVAQADEPSAKLRGFTEAEHRMLATTLTDPDLGGKRLHVRAGPFTSLTPVGMSGNLTLVLPKAYKTGEGSYSNHLTFTLAGPFVTAASTNVVFVTQANVQIEYGTDDASAMRTEFLRLAESVTWVVDTGAVTLGADSVVAGSISTTAGVMTLGAGAVVTGDMSTNLGAVTLGANAKSGDISATAGAVLLGANTKTGDIDAMAGAITLGAAAETGTLDSPGAAITFGAGAIADGDVTSGFAITIGAGGLANGLVKAGAAITFGAGSGSCGYCSVAATTVGAGPVYPLQTDCEGTGDRCENMRTNGIDGGRCMAIACTSYAE